MQFKLLNKIVRWWMTPKLPEHDIYELPLLIDHSGVAKYKHLISQWFIHPIKRRLAKKYLELLKKFTNIKVIGVTGSAGKTTTKEMLYSILKQSGSVVCTKGYIDPVYNIPNTILRTRPGIQYLILEMGVEYPGEMDYYLWLSRPDVGIITNIFPTHVEFFGNETGVLKEKSKLVKNLSSDGFAVLNSGDEFLRKLKNKIPSKIVWFKPDENPLIQNANAASETARCLGVNEIDIKRGIQNYKPPVHRLSTIKLKSGASILDDSYNSNLKAALSTLNFFNNNFHGRKLCILGEMRELGKYTEESHRVLGQKVAASGFDCVICVGDAMNFALTEIRKKSKNTQTYMFDVSEYDKIVALVRPLLVDGTSLLVKGARSLRLDKIVTQLSNQE